MIPTRWRSVARRSAGLVLGLILAALCAHRASVLHRHPGEPSAWNERRFYGWARGDRVEMAARALAEIDALAQPGKPVVIQVPGERPRDQRWWLTLALYHLPQRPPPEVLLEAVETGERAEIFRIGPAGSVTRVRNDAPR